MEFLLLTIALTLMLGAGCGVTLLLAARNNRLHMAELCGLSVIFGFTIITLTFCLAGLLVRGRSLWFIGGTVCFALFIAGLLRARKSWIGIIRPGPGGFADRLCMVILLAEFCFIVWLALHIPLGWDGFFAWEAKARIAYLSGGMLPPELFRSAPMRFVHPEYPPLVPLSEVWLYGWLGSYHQGTVKLLGPLWYIAAAGLIYAFSSRLTQSIWARWLPVMLMPLIPLLIIRDGSVTSGYADFPLALCYMAAVRYLAEYYETGNAGGLPLLGGICFVLPLIKQEGAILWLCIVVLVSLEAIRHRTWRHITYAALPGAIASVGWMLAMRLVNAPTGQDFLPLTTATFLAGLDRIPTLMHMLLVELINWRRWGLLWPALLLVLPLLYRHRKQQTLNLLLLAAFLPVPAYLGLYLFISTANKSLVAHIDASLPRLLLHVSLLALLLVSLGIAPGHTDRDRNTSHA